MAIAASLSLPSAVPAPAPRPVAAAAESGDWDFSFHDLVSIVNPLQHFPVVSTLYRKLSGDTIKPLERIAGDTLYGGWMGLVSSVANLVFEKETGKDFGDTVLALLDDGKDSQSAIADNTATGQDAASPAVATRAPTPLWQDTPGNSTIAPVSTDGNDDLGGLLRGSVVLNQTSAIPAAPAGAPISLEADPFGSAADVPALASSLAAAHVDAALGQRALYAYRRSMGMSAAPVDASSGL